MWKKVLLAVALLVVAAIAYVAIQPSTFRVARAAVIAAPADVVYAQVADFRAWQAWSPWEKLDPNQRREHSGAPSGKGAVYFWSGNDQVGEGRMTIVEARPADLVSIQLEFIKPWQSVNETEFRLLPDAGGTRVEWSMVGHNGFVEKAMGVFMNWDALIGADFEKGLAAMKGIAEAEARRAAQPEPEPAPPREREPE
jgi:uncharacterized protein YndB with AHSA1/START domain